MSKLLAIYFKIVGVLPLVADLEGSQELMVEALLSVCAAKQSLQVPFWQLNADTVARSLSENCLTVYSPSTICSLTDYIEPIYYIQLSDCLIAQYTSLSD